MKAVLHFLLLITATSIAVSAPAPPGVEMIDYNYTSATGASFVIPIPAASSKSEIPRMELVTFQLKRGATSASIIIFTHESILPNMDVPVSNDAAEKYFSSPHFSTRHTANRIKVISAKPFAVQPLGLPGGLTEYSEPGSHTLELLFYIGKTLVTIHCCTFPHDSSEASRAEAEALFPSYRPLFDFVLSHISDAK